MVVSWERPDASIFDNLLYYIVQNREVLGGGQFGVWQETASGIDRGSTSYTITFPTAGNYEYRVIGLMSGDIQTQLGRGQVSPGQPIVPTTATRMLCFFQNLLLFCPVIIH